MIDEDMIALDLLGFRCLEETGRILLRSFLLCFHSQSMIVMVRVKRSNRKCHSGSQCRLKKSFWNETGTLSMIKYMFSPVPTPSTLLICE